jgi:Protein of unknown function (DUF551)
MTDTPRWTAEQMERRARDFAFGEVRLDDVAAMLRQAAETERQWTWQPIATAPKDEEILVVDTARQVWSAILSNATWITTDGNQIFVAFTHWQPLPAPPEEAR